MTLKDDVTTVAVLKALRDTVDAEYQAVRRRVFDQLCTARAELGLKSTRVTLPDGTPVATITLVDPAPAIVVVDDEAFTAWMARNYPSEVETRVRVRASWQKHFLSRLDPTDDPVADPSTGEVVAGLRTVPASEPRSFALRSVPGGTEEIARAWRRGELDLRELLPLDGGQS
jgi:hypothetical protein